VDRATRTYRLRGPELVLFSRNGVKPSVDATATVAPSASVVGNVTIGTGCYIGHGAVVESSGPPVDLGTGVLVMANTVIRSTGGRHRPAFPVTVGANSLVAPQSALIGCRIGADCYVATAVIVFQGAEVGDGTRVGAGSIVHAGALLPPASRVGFRQVAAPDGTGVRVTSDLDEARRLVGQADFFGNVFDAREDDTLTLHRQVIETLQRELSEWHDEPTTGPSPAV
jgi:carbonic anhydrase/acetyltransferase-like protein (isoleucine patch superfamily)